MGALPSLVGPTGDDRSPPIAEIRTDPLSEGPTARAALLAACKDDDPDVRQPAAQALEDWIVRQKFPRPAAGRRS